MPWSIVYFGRHKGKTLPQIILSDPDWFFWAIEEEVFKDRGSLAVEAQEVYKKATSIKIPNNDNGELVAEYSIHKPSGKFSGFHMIPSSRPHYEGSSSSFRKTVIDMSVPRKLACYDKWGCKQLLSSLKLYVFGDKSVRMTKKKCEDFFGTSGNFE